MAGLVTAVAAILHFGAVSVSNSLNEGMSGLDGLQQALGSVSVGKDAAEAAQRVTGKESSPLTVATLNSELPGFLWVGGTTDVSHVTSNKQVVSVSVSPGHIETAVAAVRGSCSYGLSITSSNDALIAQDRLPGPGSYGQLVLGGSPCLADAALRSGWAPGSPLSSPSGL